MRYSVLVVFVLFVNGAHAQFRVASGTQYASQGARVTVRTTGNVIIDQQMEMNNTVFGFAGSNQNLQITNSLSVLGVAVANGTSVRLGGDLTVTGNIVFDDGYIIPGTGKLLYTGSETLMGSEQSHVRGMMWSMGTGIRSFPIASSDNIYAPFVLLGVNEGNVELGVEAIHSNPNVANIPPDIPEVSQNWHWQVSTRGTGFSGAVATLPIQTEDESLFSGANRSGVVIQANSTRDLVESLGGSVGPDAVTSANPGVGPLFFLGTVLEVELSIHNIISPNGDGSNDFLVIENLGLLGVDNEVILLDRWGVKVYEKKGFVNFDAISNPYDGSFDFLEPGNYICILKIPSRKTTTQTITVIRE